MSITAAPATHPDHDDVSAEESGSTARGPVIAEYVRWFAGYSGKEIAVGPRSQATGQLVGNVIVCGRPYVLSGSPVELDPDAEIHRIEQRLRDLDGKFSLLAMGKDRCVLATDILGTGGAFISESRRGTLVASNLGTLASLVDDLEYVEGGVVAALIGGPFIGGVTPFAGIRRLQAAEYALIDLRARRGPVIRKYGDPGDVLVPHGEQSGSPHELGELIEAAVARECPDERTGLLLTRGKDSRALGHALQKESRAAITAFTYGGWRSTDRRESRQAARRIGIKHRRVGPMRLRLADHADTITRFGAGQSGLQVSQHLAGAARVGRLVNVALAGFLGDILTGHPFSPEFEHQQRMVQSRHMPWLQISGVPLAKMFPDEVNMVRDHLFGLLRHYDELPPGRGTTLIDLTHRQATYISGAFDLMGHHVDIATPFFYRPLIQYLLTRRSEDLFNQRLYSEMLGDSDSRLPERGSSPIDRLARYVDRKVGSRYTTVNWAEVINRERSWLHGRLVPYAGEDRVARLGISSLETDAILPLALFAIPLVETRYSVYSSR